MTLFAIGDLHLPGGEEKPMDIFGDHWENHFAHIAADWRARVKDGDVVLIPGDISWAMQLERAVPDLQKIGALPGRKVLIKGNHDYWWNSVSKLRRVLPEGMSALQHDALDMGDFVVCGTRGWMFPTGDAPLAPEDERILNRELLRLDMAISAAEKLAQGREADCRHAPLSAAAADRAGYAVHADACAAQGAYGGVRSSARGRNPRGVQRRA